MDYFHLDPEISFDSEGVIMFKGDYNALKMSVYGIMNFEMYLKTNDSHYLTELNNQYNYLSNPKNYSILAKGKAISYPYLFDYNDLKAPWYSGLVNAVASSFVLRYAELHEDEEAKKLAEKLVYYMILPIDQEGAKNITDDRLTWIEEYPYSWRLPQVMNGFISAVIALHEYLQVDNNPEVRAVYKACLSSLQDSFQSFDTPVWTLYSRGKSNAIRKHYMKLQIAQLLHLTNLTQDTTFYRQAMLWSVFSFGHDIDNAHEGYLNDCYNFAFPLIANENGSYGIDSLAYQRTLDKCESQNRDIPRFAFLKTVPDTLRQDSIHLMIESNQNLNYNVFYRISDSNPELYKQLWKNSNYYRRKDFTLDANWYQLKIVFECDSILPEGIQVAVNGKTNFIR